MFIDYSKDEQKRLREECAFLKGGSAVKYKDIASAIGINQNSFYNWMSGATKLGYKSRTKLDNYIKEFYHLWHQ